MGGGLSPQEKQGAIAGEGKRRRGRQPLLVFLCTHAYGQRAGHLTHRLWAKEYLLHGLKMAGHFSLGIQLVQITDSRGKSQQPSHTPELGMEFVKSVNRQHLQFHLPWGTVQKRALQQSTTSLLSIPWENTSPVADTSKYFGLQLHLPEGHMVFLPFLGLHLQHMKVPRLGVELEL